ncbi:MAG: NTP transferase domain-containing protein [Bdellovibrionales bacterium]
MLQKTHLIVPMAGSGVRFREAGYESYKPLITIANRPMIDYVLGNFPKSMAKHLIIHSDYLSASEKKYLVAKSDVILHEIKAHSLGPAYSLSLASETLPLEESWFVSYCDVAWVWDFKAVRKNLDSDAIAFTHQKFHPHLVKDNSYAFCRVEDTRLLEIKEKGSFTKNWMQEPVSAGVFYFKKGWDLITAIAKQMEQHQKVQGEYFPSLALNELLKNQKRVTTQEVDFFLHWGTPEQLQDFLKWQKILTTSTSHEETPEYLFWKNNYFKFMESFKEG